MFFDTTVAGWMMQMPIVQVIHMTFVLDRGVPAVGAMLMIVIRVLVIRHSRYSSLVSIIGSLP
jgi:hypothetical protein